MIDCLNTINWKDLLALNSVQIKTIDAAIRRAQENSAILHALEADCARMSSGDRSFSLSSDELRSLYGEELFRMHAILVLLMRLPWLIEQYSAHGIPDEVLRDTLSDVRIWMDVCHRQTGHYGMLEYGWLCYHFSFKLFRIGRLQFIQQSCSVPAHVYRSRISGTVMALCPNGAMYHQNGDGAVANGRPLDGAWQAQLREESGCVEGFPIHRSGHALPTMVKLDLTEWECVLKPGDPVLDMHIAEGCPLDPESVKRSLDQAPDFFRRYLVAGKIHALTCSSWLLDDNIAQMQPSGNIASFQHFFYLVPSLHASDRQTKERAFNNPNIDIVTAECRTSLQRAIASWYRSGRYCRNSAGFILL